MKRIHIVGRKNSGKTTLVVDLVKEFTLRGYRVGTIKHTHHQHELDTPGKDSHSHREAGSAAVGILTRNMNAIFWPQPSEDSRSDKYAQFDAMMQECDLVLVEGDSQTDAIKIEVFRSANRNSLIAEADSSINAIVTDDVLDLNISTWKRSDLGSIAENISAILELGSPKKNG